nr:ph-response transcription factor [Quercus suber]
MATGASGGYVQHNGQYAGYGSVSYPNSSAVADIQSMDTRRRAIEALNDFLGDIKRRAINPSNYYDVGQRLQGTSLPLPVGTGYNTGYSGTTNTYNGMSAASLLEAFNHGDMGANTQNAHGPIAQQNYSLPLPNARTKNDLQDIDRFLEQLQATVYETSNQAAAAGVQQPGMHSQYTNDFGMGHGSQQYQRSSHSPPFNNVGGQSSFGNLSMSGTTGGPGSTGYDTPALTPASVSSYSSSGHSPLSSHDRSSMTSMSGNAMYPNLPAVTGMSDLGSGYPTTTSAPASSLASGFDGLDGRRYSGGRLQRAAPSQDTEMADVEDRETTPKPGQTADSQGKPHGNILDPALHHDDSAADSPTTSADDKRQEDWVENIRAIEALRKWIFSRLEQGDFEADARPPQSEDSKPAMMDESAQQMAETAKMVEEKMADVAAAVKDTASYGQDDVQYPTLPGA